MGSPYRPERWRPARIGKTAIELGKFTGACSDGIPAAGHACGQWILPGVLAAVLGFGSLLANSFIGYPVAGLIELPIFPVGLFCSMAGAMTVLTDQGRIAGPTLGLKRYMEDFSNFTDRGAGFGLWDWYGLRRRVWHSDRVMRAGQGSISGQRSGLAGCQRSNSLFYWNYRPHGRYSHRHNGPFDHDAAGQMDPGISGPFRPRRPSFAGGFPTGSQLNSGLADISSTISAVHHPPIPWRFSSFGSGGGSGFGGSFGGSGGGSFGGR